MKSALSLIVSVLSCTLTFAEFEVPHLIANGTAETQVTPDEMHWTLMIETKGQAIEEVAGQHLEEVGSVLAYLKDSQIKEEDLKTSRMQLRENWTHRGGNRLLDGYIASTTVIFKTLDFDSYVTHWTRLSRFRNVMIGGVQFGISNVREIQDQTLLKAIEVARENAEKMACVLGVDLMEPLLLEDAASSMPRRVQMASAEMRAMDYSGGSVVSPGTETISATVRIVYRISVKE